MKLLTYLLVVVILGTGCIGDDIVLDEIPERLNISNAIDSLQVGATFQFSATFFNNVGVEENQNIEWASSNEDLVTIDAQGLATGLVEGTAQIYANTIGINGDFVGDTMDLVVTEEVIVNPPTGSNDSRSGEIQTTSSYVLEGSFTLSETDNGLVLDIDDNYRASSSLPGLYVYLTNNPNTLNNALEISKVTVFEGAHAYDIPSSVDLNTYSYVLYFCKPFGVKVGDGLIGD